MDTVEEELWNIFSHYALHGNPRDPSKMPCSQFLKLCRDTLVLDHTMTDRPLTQADIQLICTAELRNKSAGTAPHSDRLEYTQFLSCLLRVALKCYPNAKNSEDSMQQLLMDNVLPLASRRKPVALNSFLNQPPVEQLFRYYEDAFAEIYRFYAASSEVKSRSITQTTSGKKKEMTFDDHKVHTEEAKKEKSSTRPGSQMSYPDFLRFAGDFGLTGRCASHSVFVR
jgi:hypothetical protein